MRKILGHIINENFKRTTLRAEKLLSFRVILRQAQYDNSVFVVFSKQRVALTSVFMFTAMLFFSSCEKGHRTDCFKGTGNIITENKAIEVPFDTIKTNGRIRVNLIQDSLNYLEISTGENLVDGIEFNVVNNTLTIEDHIKCNWVRRLDHVPLVTIHYTTLHYFSAGNYFDNYFLSVHKGDNICLDYWTGSGITHFNGDVDEAYFKVNAGSGGFEAAGHARFCYMYHAGGSRWNMSGFDAPEVYVNTLSNNDVHVRCDSLLWCDIRRTGNIYYTGSPSQIIRNGMGSGQIIHE